MINHVLLDPIQRAVTFERKKRENRTKKPGLNSFFFSFFSRVELPTICFIVSFFFTSQINWKIEMDFYVQEFD
jgi:hypothetical protein